MTERSDYFISAWIWIWITYRLKHTLGIFSDFSDISFSHSFSHETLKIEDRQSKGCGPVAVVNMNTHISAQCNKTRIMDRTYSIADYQEEAFEEASFPPLFELPWGCASRVVQVRPPSMTASVSPLIDELKPGDLKQRTGRVSYYLFLPVSASCCLTLSKYCDDENDERLGGKTRNLPT